MPELPEVETIRRGLQRFIIGYRINRVEVREPRLRWPIDVERLKQMAQSKTVLDIGRRAKYLLIHLQEDTTLVIHLGMSGNLLLINTPVPLEKHDHVSFYFVNGAELRYRDPRRFGMIDVTQTSELGQYERLKNLGAEPLSPSTRAWDLYQKAQTTNRAIKILLMDSHFIVGVGNIYANEALFHAGIHPFTPARELSEQDWQRLLIALRKVLKAAIRQGGTTLNDFVNSEGDSGYFQLSLAVYGREGEPCPVCGTPITRQRLGQRSTFFCPRCQK